MLCAPGFDRRVDDVWAVDGGGDLMSLVMGMDQHRAQISADWIDTITGEVSRVRVAPADRAGVRKFLTGFKGESLEVALEATTGWRFLAEELDRVGAEVHLAEVVQTRGMQDRGKRPKTDWADARHLRELLLIGRLPESWIAPAHLLDLRARVRCRHTLVHQRTEWQQRMQAVLYHHGCPHSRKLLSLENRTRLAALRLPAAAREQLTIALEMIDAIDLQLGPFDFSLRDYARKQTGCCTLTKEIYGIGELTTVTILAELGDTRRFQNSRDAVRYSGLDITIRESDRRFSATGGMRYSWPLSTDDRSRKRPEVIGPASRERHALRMVGPLLPVVGAAGIVRPRPAARTGELARDTTSGRHHGRSYLHRGGSQDKVAYDRPS